MTSEQRDPYDDYLGYAYKLLTSEAKEYIKLKYLM